MTDQNEEQKPLTIDDITKEEPTKTGKILNHGYESEVTYGKVEHVINLDDEELDEIEEEEDTSLDDIFDQEEEEEVEVESVKVEEKRKPNARVEQFINTGGAFEKGHTVNLPSVGLTEFNEKIQQFNKVDIENLTDELTAWREVSEGAVEFYTPNDTYSERFTDPTSEFRQGIEDKEGNLSGIAPVKFRSGGGGELKGNAAVLKVSRMLGLGDVINIPLPHSGIWVTIKPATEKDLIDFYNSIFREKIMLGRSTYGLTLTNFSTYVNKRLFEFIVNKHVHAVNYDKEAIPKEKLQDYILIHDYHVLVWGFICSLYPNGYNYSRVCVNDIEKCTAKEEAKLNLAKLLWIDNKSLSEVQKNILYEVRPGKLNSEHYKKFISEHTRVSSTVLTLKQGIKVTFKVPTFAEHINDGMSWITTINNKIESEIIDADLGDDKEEEAKNELLTQYVKSSALRSISHFIDYIEFTEDKEIVTDRRSISQILETVSGDDEIRNKITEAVLKFQSDTTIALIGIPEYTCKSCNSPQNPDPYSERFSSVIPLDVLGLVFLLLTSKIWKILEREV